MYSERQVGLPPLTPEERGKLNPWMGRRVFLAAATTAAMLAACGGAPENKKTLTLPSEFTWSEEMLDEEREEANAILATRLLNKGRQDTDTEDDFTSARINKELARVDKILISGDIGQMYRGFWYLHTTPARIQLLDGLTFIRETAKLPELPDLPVELKNWCRDNGIRKEVLAMCRDRFAGTAQFMNSIKGEIGRASDPVISMMINSGGAATVLSWETGNFERVGDWYTGKYWDTQVLEAQKEVNKYKSPKDQGKKEAAQKVLDRATNQRDSFDEYVERLSEMTTLTYDRNNIAGGPTGEIGCQVMPENLIRFDNKMIEVGERFNAYSGVRFPDFLTLMFAERLFDGNWNVVSPGYVRGDGRELARYDAIRRYNPGNPKETQTIYDNTHNYAKVIADAEISH